MKESKIKFPVGPNEYASGLLRKASHPSERIPVSVQRFVDGKLEVKLPNGEWYRVTDADYFGADV